MHALSAHLFKIIKKIYIGAYAGVPYYCYTFNMNRTTLGKFTILLHSHVWCKQWIVGSIYNPTLKYTIHTSSSVKLEFHEWLLLGVSTTTTTTTTIPCFLIQIIIKYIWTNFGVYAKIGGKKKGAPIFENRGAPNKISLSYSYPPLINSEEKVREKLIGLLIIIQMQLKGTGKHGGLKACISSKR